MSHRVKSDYFIEAVLGDHFKRSHVLQFVEELRRQYGTRYSLEIEEITEGGIKWTHWPEKKDEREYKSLRFPFHATWPSITPGETAKDVFDNDKCLHNAWDMYNNPAVLSLMYKIQGGTASWTRFDSVCVARALRSLDCIRYVYLDTD